ncbi:MAG: TadE/TadG family type IV pilus assembly protein [Candidatus Cybelea sp.]|jgi:Flp pilus assembly protein TadG
MTIPHELKDRTRTLVRCESGTSLVEFAIVLPFLALLLIGLIDFGRYTYDAVLAANAARAAVQYGAQNLEKAKDYAGMRAAGAADAPTLSGLTVTPNAYCSVSGVTGSCTTAGAVAYVQVNASGTFSPLIKYPGLPASVPVTGSALMRVENQ